MKRFFILFILLIAGVLCENLYAQYSYRDSETTKLRKFLLQESAEPGVKNYQQLGMSQIDDINWGSVPGLLWTNQTYLLDIVDWSNKKLSGHLDLSGFEALRMVYCSDNELNSIDVAGSSSIKVLDCFGNNFYSLDFSTNVNLTHLCFRDNNLREIDLSNNKKLTDLYCTNNQLEYLDLSGLGELSTFYCVSNNLVELNINGCTRLRNFLCMENNLTTLDVSNKKYLVEFSCARNNITDINVTNCSSMVIFDCCENKLETLDLKGCSSLSYLKCSGNILKNLLLDDCQSLEELYCEENSLASLKLPDSPSLNTIHCKNNEMDFYSLPTILSNYTNYVYYPQKHRDVEFDFKSVDLSDFFEIESIVSRYLWYEYVNLLKPEMGGDGIFRFEESFLNKKLTCRIENGVFPKLVLRYEVTLTNGDVGNVIPEKNQSYAYSSEGYIHIIAASSGDVKIYSLQGALLMARNIEEGRTDIPFVKGMYVVSINNGKACRFIVR